MPPVNYVVLSGVCWLGVYSLLVIRGFKDKSYGMPLLPLSMNLAWESVFSLVYRIGASSPARVIIYIWAILDLFILATFFLYGYKYFEKNHHLTRLQFCAIGILAIACAYAFFIAAPPFLLSIPFFKGSMFEVASFLAYAPNSILISTLFVHLVWRRKSIEGQSFYIGLLKWFGTLIVAVWYVFEHNYLFVWLMIGAIETFDILYLKMIYQKLRANSVNPWRRL